MLNRLLVLLSCCGLAGLAGCSKSRSVAAVNGKDISEDLFVSAMTSGHGHGMETLQSLIEYNLVMEELQKRKLKVTPEEIDKSLKAAQGPEWKRSLRDSGAAEADVRRQKEFELALLKIVTDGIEVSDADVKKFYETNKPMFMKPPVVQFARIITKTKEEAERVFQRLGEGGQFSDLAKEHSLDQPEIRENGGVAGPAMPIEQWPPEYVNAARNRAMNAPSAPFQHGGLWVIVKATQSSPPEQIKFEEVKGFIANQERLQRAAGEGRTGASVITELAQRGKVVVKHRQLLQLEQQVLQRIAQKYRQQAQPGHEGHAHGATPAPGKPGKTAAKASR